MMASFFDPPSQKLPASCSVEDVTSDAKNKSYTDTFISSCLSDKSQAWAKSGEWKSWKLSAKLSGSEKWDVSVRSWKSGDSSSNKIALFIHGFNPDDRCSAFFSNFWRPLHEAGYSILSVDLPGHGASHTLGYSEKALPSRTGDDVILLENLLCAFGANEGFAKEKAASGASAKAKATSVPAGKAFAKAKSGGVKSSITSGLKSAISGSGSPGRSTAKVSPEPDDDNESKADPSVSEPKVFVFADAGGCGPFLQLYASKPNLFGHNHVLLNPVVSSIPDNLVKDCLLGNGGSFLLLLAEAWGEKDARFEVAYCKQFLNKVVKMAGDRCEFLTFALQKNALLKNMKEVGYLVGEEKVTSKMKYNQTHQIRQIQGTTKLTKSGKCHVLNLSEGAEQDFVGFISKPPKPKVLDASTAATNAAMDYLSVIQKSAVELGKADGNFGVFVRIRPFLDREKKFERCMNVQDVKDFPRDPPPQRISVLVGGGVELGGSGDEAKDKANAKKTSTPASGTSSGFSRGEFVFDRVFEESADQEKIFQSVAEPLINNCMDEDLNGTIFAYGQTGTGKTYTMDGPSNDTSTSNKGLMTRCIQKMFSKLKGSEKVRFQYVQLYNKDWLDLLNPPASSGGKSGGGDIILEETDKFMYCRNAKIHDAGGADELLKKVATGAEFRATGKTNMNDASSRSHAILLVFVVDEAKGKGEASSSSSSDLDHKQVAKVLYLVDLAGSERLSRSGAFSTSSQFDEATSVNMSLTALGRVVTGLVAQNQHIPYRDDPLTHLLKTSVGGNSKTALICCTTGSSDSMEESLQTLRFAVQASFVKNKVQKLDAKKEEAAKAEAITANAAAADFKFDDDGCGVIKVDSDAGLTDCGLANGNEIEILGGNWPPSNPLEKTIILVHDIANEKKRASPAGFLDNKEVIKALVEKGMTVISPKLSGDGLKGEVRNREPCRKIILKLMDYLGLAKAVIWGRDWGGIVAVEFKLKNPTRVSTLIVENKADRISDPKKYKASPSANRKAVFASTPWQFTFDFDMKNKGNQKSGKPDKNVKGLKGGPCFMLWPYVADSGRPDPQMRDVFNNYWGEGTRKNLKAVMKDSLMWTEAECADAVKECVMGE